MRVFAEHPRPHWAWAVEVLRLGAPGARGIYLRYPPQAYPRAFVSVPSFCVAAATSIGWDIPLALNLTTGDLFVFSPLLTPRFGGPFSSFLWVVRCQPDIALVSVLRMSLPQCLFSPWVSTGRAGCSVQSLHLPSICEEMLMESGIESSRALCLRLGKKSSKTSGPVFPCTLDGESRRKAIENKNRRTVCGGPGIQKV